MEALYQFCYGLSHEINNPLANIAMRAQTLLADEKDPERRRKLTAIVQQAFRAHEMIADLMLFARPPAMQPENTDVAALADTVVAELRPVAQQQGTQLTRGGAVDPLRAMVDGVQFAVALKALVQNALEAVRERGSVQVVVMRGEPPGDAAAESRVDPPHTMAPVARFPKRRRPKPENCIYLTVSDDGPGISEEARLHLFDPFYSGREAGRGLGLGLSKAWRIVELHGGQIAAESRPGEGARFTILLPATAG
jgi:signal transduction histidine kinase